MRTVIDPLATTQFMADAPVPVPQARWFDFSTEAERDSTLALVKDLTPSAEAYDATFEDGETLAYLPESRSRLWGIRGTIDVGDDNYPFKFQVGVLLNRQDHPQLEMDGYEKTLAVRVISGVANICWAGIPGLKPIPDAWVGSSHTVVASDGLAHKEVPVGTLVFLPGPGCPDTLFSEGADAQTESGVAYKLHCNESAHLRHCFTKV